MKLVERPRGLNARETYACSIKDIREKFEQYDIMVGIGSIRTFQFDGALRHPPRITGTVVSSLSYNNIITTESILNLYVFDGSNYAEQYRKIFKNEYLEQMRRWLDAQLNKNQVLGGHEEILVTWDNGSFQIRELRWQ